MNELMGSLSAHEEKINRSKEKCTEYAFHSRLGYSSKNKGGRQVDVCRGRGFINHGRGIVNFPCRGRAHENLMLEEEAKEMMRGIRQCTVIRVVNMGMLKHIALTRNKFILLY